MEAATCKSPGFPTRGKVAAWTARFCAQLDQAEITPADHERFQAELHTGELGALRFARLSCIGSAIGRMPAADCATLRSYTLIVQLTGSGLLCQYGQQATMQAGDLALCDNAAPHSHHMAERSELILVRIPAALLREHLPSAEQFCGRRLAGGIGTTQVAVSLITSLCSRPTGLPLSVQAGLAHQVLETLAISYTLAFEELVAPSSVVGGRYAKARRYIEQNLRDPELGPQKIARSLNVSSRYLRMIFAGEHESVSSYILRRRLEEVAQQLTDARWRGRSICEIAFGWGFNSAPHFSRSFRERYGMSPREYRLLKSGPDASAKRDTLAAAS